jgi:hypothetical protein
MVAFNREGMALSTIVAEPAGAARLPPILTHGRLPTIGAVAAGRLLPTPRPDADGSAPDCPLTTRSGPLRVAHGYCQY